MKISDVVVVGFTFVFLASTALPLRAADPQSDGERLQNLERAVQQLQQRNVEQEQRNAELEREVQELKSKKSPFVPVLAPPEGKAAAGL